MRAAAAALARFARRAGSERVRAIATLRLHVRFSALGSFRFSALVSVPVAGEDGEDGEVGESAVGVGRGGARSRSGEVGSRRVRVLSARLTLWRSVRGGDGVLVGGEAGVEVLSLSMREYWGFSVAIAMDGVRFCGGW